ncbi:hypothetical protein ACGFX8_35800 [Streptomyces sp. NPDC048362]|uniref:hypothetical protein n=1 Tax=Streptomyces sp. NPDC048362 TaxID=3365539 RepID=UPI0037142FAC
MLTGLRRALESAGLDVMLRDLTTHERQSATPGDPSAVLADRVAMLDRPAFAHVVTTGG